MIKFKKSLLFSFMTLCSSANAMNLLINPHFESDTAGWTFTSGTGVAANNSQLGDKAAYLDQGIGYQISQTVHTAVGGDYDVSFFASAAKNGGYAEVWLDGVLIESLPILAGAYRPYRTDQIAVSAGSSLSVLIKSSAEGWINVDAFVVQQSTSNFSIESSNAYLNSTFDWAKKSALTFAQTANDSSHIPSYWAGYVHRQAFYSRDVAHQMLGAGILGLHEENLSMVREFAKSATPSKQYYPLWSIGFDGSVYTMDYVSDTNFVRIIPAPFELVEKSHEQYLWTGNNDWINDADLKLYYANTMTNFIHAHDFNNNGIADEVGTGIFNGMPTYNEHFDIHLREASDGLAAQYKANIAYSGILKASGAPQSTVDFYLNTATNILNTFRATWWSPSSNRYIIGYDQTWTPSTAWNRETTFFPAMKGILEPGSKAASVLSHIDASINMPNVEAKTYLPEVFWPYGQIERGWHYFKEYTGTRDPYPELSFTAVSQIVSLMAGVEPNAPENKISTRSQFPVEIDWLKLKNLEIGDHQIDLHHQGSFTSKLHHVSGSSDLNWEAAFSGQHGSIYVDGEKHIALTRSLPSGVISYTNILVEPGNTALVQVPHLITHSSGKCVSAGVNPTLGSTLTLTDNCDSETDGFILLENKLMLHAATGFCVHPRGGNVVADAELILWDSCNDEARLRVQHLPSGSLTNPSTGLCVHPQGGAANPPSGTPLIYFAGCNGNRLSFSIN